AAPVLLRRAAVHGGYLKVNRSKAGGAAVTIRCITALYHGVSSHPAPYPDNPSGGSVPTSPRVHSLQSRLRFPYWVLYTRQSGYCLDSNSRALCILTLSPQKTPKGWR